MRRASSGLSIDRFSAGLALANWCVLLLLLCTLLLAKSLPTDSVLTGSNAAAQCATETIACPSTPVR